MSTTSFPATSPAGTTKVRLPLSFPLIPELTPYSVISQANTIHLALLTSRIPILPAFLGHPGQLGGVSLITDPELRLPFSAVFDLPRLVSVLRERYPDWKGVVEWEEVVELGHWPRINESDGQQSSTTSSLGEWWELGCWQCFPDPLDFAFVPYHIS